MNLLGVDVSTLDVPAFLAGARQLFPLLALLWLAVLIRLRRPWWLLLGVLAANAWAWGATNYPLQRLYGLGPSHDRIGNLGLCQVVAAGNSPLHTTQLGQLHFEPFWGLLVALVSGFDPDRVLLLYPFFSLVMVIAFPLALFFGLKTGETEGFSPWERALVAGFATLLSSSALDYLGTYRVPWAKMFLLKPNHALGLVLLPLFLAVFVRTRGLRGRLGAGLLLQLLGWAFVLHMVYVCVGLVVFAGLSLLTRHPEARRDLRDVLTVIGINVLVVSPYLVMLLVGYPFLVRSSSYALPAFSPHLLEPTLRTGAVFWLGLWGLLVLSRGDRMSRLFLGQVLGGYLIWAGYLALGLVGLARERDEIYFWLRILMAASAAVGAWDLAARVAGWLGPEAWSPAGRAAAVGILALPLALPTWWDPARMDAYFAGSLPPLPAALSETGEFLRHHSQPRAVLAGDPQLTRYAAALAGRRGLVVAGMNATRDWRERLGLQEQLLTSENPRAVSAAAARYGVGYLLVGPAYLAEHSALTLADLDRKGHLRRLHLAGEPDGDFVAIYQVGSP
jgi:hypothetical protein